MLAVRRSTNGQVVTVLGLAGSAMPGVRVRPMMPWLPPRCPSRTVGQRTECLRCVVCAVHSRSINQAESPTQCKHEVPIIFPRQVGSFFRSVWLLRLLPSSSEGPQDGAVVRGLSLGERLMKGRTVAGTTPQPWREAEQEGGGS